MRLLAYDVGVWEMHFVLIPNRYVFNCVTTLPTTNLVRIVSLVVSAAPSASGARVLPRVPVVVVPRRAIVVVRTAVPSAPTTAVPIPRIIPIVVAAAVMITSSTTAVRATTTGTSPAMGVPSATPATIHLAGTIIRLEEANEKKNRFEKTATPT